MVAHPSPQVMRVVIAVDEDSDTKGRVALSRAQLQEKADQLNDVRLPGVMLRACRTSSMSLEMLAQGRLVIYLFPGAGAYPLKGIRSPRLDRAEHCGFRDHRDDFAAHGYKVVGISTQHVAELALIILQDRLPHELLSDELLRLGQALGVPTFEVDDGTHRYYRMTLMILSGVIQHAFVPNTPERNAAQVCGWLRSH